MLTISQAAGLSQIYQWRAGGEPETSWTGSFDRMLQTAAYGDILPVHVTSKVSNVTSEGFDVVAIAGLQTLSSDSSDDQEVASFIKRITTIEIQTVDSDEDN